jgi:hypothetical protein
MLVPLLAFELLRRNGRVEPDQVTGDVDSSTRISTSDEVGRDDIDGLAEEMSKVEEEVAVVLEIMDGNDSPNEGRDAGRGGGIPVSIMDASTSSRDGDLSVWVLDIRGSCVNFNVVTLLHDFDT